MENDLKRRTPATQARIAALEKTSQATCADNAILWLADLSYGNQSLLISYFVGQKAKVNYEVQLYEIAMSSEDLEKLLHSKIPDDIEIELRIQLEQLSFEPYAFSLYTLRSPNFDFEAPSMDKQLDFMGILALDHKNPLQKSNQLTLQLEALALQIQVSQLKRLSRAVSTTQDILDQIEKDVDSSLMKIGHMMKCELGAKRFFYKNDNALPEWSEVINTGEKFNIANPPAELIPQSLLGRPNRIEKHTIDLRDETSKKCSNNALIVSFNLPAYTLAKCPFTEATGFLDNLILSSTSELHFLFYNKYLIDCLQTSFSATDMQVAQSVFGYIEKYASARIFDRNSSHVLQFLKHSTNSANSLEEIFNLLRSLSVRFKSLSVVQVISTELHQPPEISSTDENNGISEEYLDRLRNSYLSTFSAQDYETKSAKLYFGLDEGPDHFRIEVHFPGAAGKSLVYVAWYAGQTISSSVLSSFMSLFAEIFIRAKKEEHQNERAAYLMQVRHAVIHHFSAAYRSIKSIKPLWDKGQKHPTYWASLLEDPVLKDELARALGSLGQASLIIENGKFLLGEIDPKSLNRKPYKFAAIVQNCLHVLQDIRDEKKLVIISKISGSPPKIMNADEALLNVAVMNLFDNAIKYSPHRKKVRWTIEYFKDHFRFEIANVGDPLEPQEKGLIFQIGIRGHQRDRLNQRHGTGLGLPVARKILRAHSPLAELELCVLDYDNELGGHGNIFFFDMPYLTGQS